MKDALVIRHVAFEDLGLLAPLLDARGFRITYLEAPTAAFDDHDALAADLLVVLGGPIGACDEALYPFLGAEVDFVERRLRAARPMLGICLGSQLMARALGAEVYPAAEKEIGWAPVELTDDGRQSCLRHLADVAVLHWHGDTFDLPAGAVRLASTGVCVNQAFAWGPAALGLQFHAEAVPPGLERWFVGHAVEIAATPGVSVPALRADTARFGPIVEERGQRCFGEWLSEIAL